MKTCLSTVLFSGALDRDSTIECPWATFSFERSQNKSLSRARRSNSRERNSRNRIPFSSQLFADKALERALESNFRLSLYSRSQCSNFFPLAFIRACLDGVFFCPRAQATISVEERDERRLKFQIKTSISLAATHNKRVFTTSE